MESRPSTQTGGHRKQTKTADPTNKAPIHRGLRLSCGLREHFGHQPGSTRTRRLHETSSGRHASAAARNREKPTTEGRAARVEQSHSLASVLDWPSLMVQMRVREHRPCLAGPLCPLIYPPVLRRIMPSTWTLHICLTSDLCLSRKVALKGIPRVSLTKQMLASGANN